MEPHEIIKRWHVEEFTDQTVEEAALHIGFLFGTIQQLTATLALIACPARPDGTYNRSREAREQLARDTLNGIKF